MVVVGERVISFDNQREWEVFQMIVKDADLNEIRDDVREEAYKLWQSITDGLRK